MQKVLQAATAENDNPDVRDRAYVYWRLLSSDPQIAKNIVLSTRPQITTTIPVLSRPLLDSLIPNLSTLASVYHKPPQSFLGQGRSSALQAEAIEEAKQNARENPIAASAVTAAISGTNSTPQAQTNAENLLDMDFDGAAPASMQKAPVAGLSGLEDMMGGTPETHAGPVSNTMSNGGGAMDDFAGMFGGSNGVNGSATSALENDMMNGFASMDMGQGQPPPPRTQLDGVGEKKTTEDLLGLF